MSSMSIEIIANRVSYGSHNNSSFCGNTSSLSTPLDSSTTCIASPLATFWRWRASTSTPAVRSSSNWHIFWWRSRFSTKRNSFVRRRTNTHSPSSGRRRRGNEHIVVMRRRQSNPAQSMGRCVGTFLVLLLSLCCGDGDAAVVQDAVVTTTACSTARTSPFSVRLDTLYLYNVEYLRGAELDVGEIEGAIDMSLASGLDSCNEQSGEPEHGVIRTWDDRHEIVTGASCTVGNPSSHRCSLVRGVTSVVMTAVEKGTEDTVYSIIASFLQEESFMHRFTTTAIVRMNFVRPIGENLVFSSDDIVLDVDATTKSSRSSATAAAFLSAMLSFACTAAILVGLYNRREANSAACDDQNPLQKRWVHFRAQHRDFFHNLDDEKSFPVRLAVTEDNTESAEEAIEEGAITWSVSDLTSDGESIIGSLRLDPIDEEAGEHDEATTSQQETGSVLPPATFCSNTGQLAFIPSWEPQQNLLHAVVPAHKEEVGSSMFTKADISWLEDHKDGGEKTDPNESQEVSEGTLVGCAFLTEDEHANGAVFLDTASAATTPAGNVQQEQDSLTVSVGDDEEESKYHSPSLFLEEGSTTSTIGSEQITEYLSPTQSPSSGQHRCSVESPSSAKEEVKEEVDIFLISWARDALSKIKNGEAFQGDKK